MTVDRADLSDTELAATTSFHAGEVLGLLLLNRSRGVTVERLAELTRLSPGTLALVLADWHVDEALAARA